MTNELKSASFEELFKVNVNEHTETRGELPNGKPLTYLSWAWAWAAFKKMCPKAKFKVIHNEEQGGNPMFKSGTTYEVRTSVTADGTWEDTIDMWLPIMDYRNRAIEAPNSFDVNSSLMRCLVKNLALFGLGLYIYAGEDIPQDPIKSTPTLN